MENTVDYLLVLAPALLALVLVVLRTFTRNPWIKKRLSLSIFILLAGWATGFLLKNFLPRYYVEELEILAAYLALVIAVVVLIFNRFSGASVSDRFPAIVQDALVIGVFALVGVFQAPDKLLTTSAVGGLVIGLALQDTLGNLFAGLALQVEKPLFVGDWIRVGGFEGRVKEITWRATKIRTKSGQFCVIPNTLISKDTLVNLTHPSPVVRLDKLIGFGYEAHPNEVKQVVLETMADVPEILTAPKPDVLLESYNDFSIDYRCRFWIKDFGASEIILDKFTTLLYYRLRRAGLVIPFPIRDVRVERREPPGLRAQTEALRRIGLISSIDLFSTLQENEREEIAGCLERIVFAAEETIIRQGDEGDSMYLIESGQVRIVVEQGGTVHQVAVLGSGQYFGEMALLTGEPRTASAIALSDAHAYVLSKGPFRGVLVDHPEVAETLSEVISQRRAGLQSKAEELKMIRDTRQETKQGLLGRIKAFFRLT